MASYEAAIYRADSIYLPQMIAVWKGQFTELSQVQKL